MHILILCSCSRQLRFSLYSGAVIARTQFYVQYFISDSFLALWPIPMLYALFLASCSMCSPILAYPLTLCSPLSGSQLTGLSTYLGFCNFPFYLGYSPIELWDSLSAYVHLGIACMAFPASDWLGVFGASLSGFHSSMTLVKLIVIGHCLWLLGWRT